jgi:alcohol dehydrogenase class IV
MLEAYGTAVHAKLSLLAKAAGVCDPGDNEEAASEKFIEAIRCLNREMEIPEKIDAILPGDIPCLAARAEREANPLYPVPRLMSAGQLEKIYRLVGKEPCIS